YLHTEMGIPLGTVGLILGVKSVAALPGQLIGGGLTDRLGRRTMMIFGLVALGLTNAGFAFGRSLPEFFLLAVLSGLMGTLYRPAAQAMVADLVEPERRAGAYGLFRIASNTGFTIGPALGGFLAEQSYLALFLLCSVANLVYAAIVFLGTPETKPQAPAAKVQGQAQGFGHAFTNLPFMAFCLLLVPLGIHFSQMSTILPVYMKGWLGLTESDFGWVMTTNAATVITLQYAISRWTEGKPRLKMMALGMALYAVGVGSVVVGQGLPWFIGSMFIMTLGETINMPISNVITADVAPPALRGRYMGLLNITWNTGMGIGPALGGFIVDAFGIQYVWPTVCAIGLAAAVGFLILEKTAKEHLAPQRGYANA
ncbi:MAG: MFS transporter, partial [Chloroflexi bacterium]|nr:MFS transporter [Chloroflexota bacterium]